MCFCSYIEDNNVTTSCFFVKYLIVIYRLVINRDGNRTKDIQKKKKGIENRQGCEGAKVVPSAQLQVRMSWACCSTNIAMFFTSPHQKSRRSFIPLIWNHTSVQTAGDYWFLKHAESSVIFKFLLFFSNSA